MEQKRNERRGTLEIRLLRNLVTDLQLYLALAVGLLVVWVMSVIVPPAPLPATELEWYYLQRLLLFPVLEEILFRGLLQGVLARRLPGRVGPLSHANLLTSLLFATSHLYSQPVAWAAATFIPSLVFGYFRDRYHHLLPAIVLHVCYNGLFFITPLLPG